MKNHTSKAKRDRGRAEAREACAQETPQTDQWHSSSLGVIKAEDMLEPLPIDSEPANDPSSEPVLLLCSTKVAVELRAGAGASRSFRFADI